MIILIHEHILQAQIMTIQGKLALPRQIPLCPLPAALPPLPRLPQRKPTLRLLLQRLHNLHEYPHLLPHTRLPPRRMRHQKRRPLVRAIIPIIIIRVRAPVLHL